MTSPARAHGGPHPGRGVRSASDGARAGDARSQAGDARTRGRGRATSARDDEPLVPGPGAGAAHLAAGAALASLVVSIHFGAAGVMLFLLVLGGVAATWVSRLPGAFQATVVVTMVACGWAGVLGGYEAIWWLDIAAHLVLTALLAVLAVAVLEVAGWLRLVPTGSRQEQAGGVVVATALGLALSVLWELGEWSGNRFVDSDIDVGYDDTLGDLAMGGAGSLVAGVLWVRWAARRARAQA